MYYIINICLNILILITTSCRFHVQNITTSTKIKCLRLDVNDQYEDLTKIIKQHLYLNNIKLINKNVKNVSILKIIHLSENTKIISFYNNGLNAEKIILTCISIQLILPNGKIYPFKIYVDNISINKFLDPIVQNYEKQRIKEQIYEQIARKLIHYLLILDKKISR